MATKAQSHQEEILAWQSQLEGADAIEIVRFAVAKFGDKVGMATSFGAEDMALMHLIYKEFPDFYFFTLDTGRLPNETYELMQKLKEQWGLNLHIFFPDARQVEQMVREKGPNLFYESLQNRKLCCRIRKVEPLKRALEPLSAWVTGLTRYQATTRTNTPVAEWDESFGLFKFNPIALWTHEQVWAYIRKNKVPYNRLHDQGYPSIGCAPCTRAVQPGEDFRAGRWWWESKEHKECGLHLKPQSNKRKE